MKTADRFSAYAYSSAFLIISAILLALVLGLSDFETDDSGVVVPALLAFVVGGALALTWRRGRSLAAATARLGRAAGARSLGRHSAASVPQPMLMHTRAYDGYVGAIAILALLMLGLVIALNDFTSDPRSGLLPAALAFVGGAALAATCWCYVRANLRRS